MATHPHFFQGKSRTTLEATQVQISSQISTDATSGRWHFEWELTEETIYLPLGSLQGGLQHSFTPDEVDALALGLPRDIPHLLPTQARRGRVHRPLAVDCKPAGGLGIEG